MKTSAKKDAAKVVATKAPAVTVKPQTPLQIETKRKQDEAVAKQTAKDTQQAAVAKQREELAQNKVNADRKRAEEDILQAHHHEVLVPTYDLETQNPHAAM
jgi:hypothetical protein